MDPALLHGSGLAVRVNGETRRFSQPTSVADAVVALGLAGRKVAVERNGNIVPRSRYAETFLGDGDTVEIVVAVGGG